MKIYNNGNFFTSRYKVGDRCVHRQTCFYGRVIGIETIDGIDFLNVKLDRGGMMNRIDRREFMLANLDRPQMTSEQHDRQVTANEYLEKIDASEGISDKSILEEIC
jgi:hypothetical protein